MAVGVRKISNAGSKKVIGKFPSLKMETAIWWESQIERDYIYLLEIDPNVKAYLSQPFKISYQEQGKLRTYTPDFWVKRMEKEQVVEVKADSQIKKSQNQQLWRIITNWCWQQGWDFLVVTDLMIRQQPKLQNIKLLFKYSRTNITQQNYWDCYNYFSQKQAITLQQAEQDLKGKGISKNQLYKLLYWGFLETDLSQTLSEESLIKLPQIKTN
jgi:hypothetical protein